MHRDARAQLGHGTLRILANGEYEAPSGRTVGLKARIDALRSATLTLLPHQLLKLRNELRFEPLSRGPHLEVTSESTLVAAARLANAAADPVFVLNFASAKNPGGGFLNGSQAQEESLARSSTLYASLLEGAAMYEANRRQASCLYTHHMIYSPEVDVFRSDDGKLLEEPYRAAFLTAAAVNVGALKPHEHSQIESTMDERTELVLTVAAHHGHRRLVLGAWGCGVFKNDPRRVAGWFAAQLRGRFRYAFSHITFAVYDRSRDQATLKAFQRELGA